jgi:hypothetical protein
VTPTELNQVEPEIVEALADVLAKGASLSDTLQGAKSDAGYDRALLSRLAELGFFGVSGPPSHGGLGLPPALVGEFCREAGRVLLGGPWLEQLLAAHLLDAVGGWQLLTDVIGGTLLVSLPLDRSAWGRPLPVHVERGHARFVSGRIDLGFATSVDGWLVAAQDVVNETTILVQLSPDAATCRARRSWSEIWRSFDVDLTDAVGVVIAEIPEDVSDGLVAQIARLLACCSVGATEAVLESTIEFLKLREQFGRPIGSFQALQHMMANVFIDLEHTRSLVRASLVWTAAVDVDVLVAMAKVAADRLAVGAAESALQAHGGVGFTWELPVHHFLKEALRRRTLPQPSALYREELSRSVRIL